MFIIPVQFKEISNLPKIKKWVKNIEKLTFSKEEFQKDKIEFICQFGYFIPKGSNTLEKFEQMFQLVSKMKYDERLEFELKKVRVFIGAKYEKLFLSDRLPKGTIPDPIYNIIKELTKVKMMVESQMHGNVEITKSIPPVDRSIVDFDIFKDIAISEIKQDFNLDDILDKINEKGINSLSDEEKKFLDNNSSK